MNIRTLSAAIAASLTLLLAAAPAQALIRTFVSTAGDDAHDCSTPAPAQACRFFQRAHDQVQDGGKIGCVDNGDFASATIIKSITIDCAGTSGTGTFTINAPNSAVTIRNLAMVGVSANGILVQNVGALAVENCAFRDIPVFGIKFTPANAGAQLVVFDSSFFQLGGGNSGGGIQIAPQGNSNAIVSIDRVTIADGLFGVAVDGSASSGAAIGIAAVIRNSTIHRLFKDGIVATTVAGGAPIGLLVKNTAAVSSNNGVRATGPGVTIRLDKATVMHNGTGLIFNNGAALLTYGNNNIDANGSNGAFSGSAVLQ